MKDTQKWKWALYTGVGGIIISFGWIAFVLYYILNKKLAKLSWPILIYLIVIFIVLTSFTIVLSIFIKGTNPWAHFSLAVLGGLICCVSFLNFVTYSFSNDIFLASYQRFWAKQRSEPSYNLEKTFECCGYSEHYSDYYAEECYTMAHLYPYCSVKMGNYFFGKYKVLGASIANVLACVLYVVFVFVEISRIEFERADYDRLQLRPIQDF